MGQELEPRLRLVGRQAREVVDGITCDPAEDLGQRQHPRFRPRAEGDWHKGVSQKVVHGRSYFQNVKRAPPDAPRPVTRVKVYPNHSEKLEDSVVVDEK